MIAAIFPPDTVPEDQRVLAAAGAGVGSHAGTLVEHGLPIVVIQSEVRVLRCVSEPEDVRLAGALGHASTPGIRLLE